MAASRELAAFTGFICRSIDRLVDCLDGLDEEGLNWRPPADGANSLMVLATHTLANAEENILGTLCGRSIPRSHAAEFAARAESAPDVRGHWLHLREQIVSVLAAMGAEDLERERAHPRRGNLTGREILIIVARHAAEHLGQAELTRDLLRAARTTLID